MSPNWTELDIKHTLCLKWTPKGTSLDNGAEHIWWGMLNQSAVHDVRLRTNGCGKTVQGLTAQEGLCCTPHGLKAYPRTELSGSQREELELGVYNVCNTGQLPHTA